MRLTDKNRIKIRKPMSEPICRVLWMAEDEAAINGEASTAGVRLDGGMDNGEDPVTATARRQRQ